MLVTLAMGAVERTSRAQRRIAARDELPFAGGHGLLEVGDGGQTMGIDGGEGEGGTPDVQLEDHGGRMGGDGVDGVDTRFCN